MNTNGDKFAVLKTWPVASWAWPKIVLFVPIIPAIPYADTVFFNFMGIVQGGVPFFKQGYAIPDMARNKAALATLASEFTHVLMLDMDHPHPEDIVQRLARRVIEDPERLVVAAVAFRRGEPFDPLLWKKRDGKFYTVSEWEKDSCFEVDMIATPAMLIHRSVFEKVKYPWFLYEYPAGMEEGVRPSEDVGFCKKVREAGIQIWCDGSIVTPHMMSVTIGQETWTTWCQMHPDKWADPILEKKAFAIAERLHLTPDQLTAKVQLASANVKAAWDKASPQSRDEVERWYGSEDNGYFFDLLNWNSTPFYRQIVEPLRKVTGKNVLVIGPGIGGEIDALLEGGNRISVYDVPGALLDFVKSYYGEKITAIDITTTTYKTFDLVVAIDVIEHIHPAGFCEFLANMAALLQDSGILYCHNNFAQQDIYPMHYAENEQPFSEWVKANFKQTGDFMFRKVTQEVMA